MLALLTVSMTPAQAAPPQMTTTSDLRVRVVSIPKNVKACQTFKATFSVTNLGPDPASHLFIVVMIPDPLGVISLRGAPESLAVGETVKFSAVIKVVAFVPGEPREAWVGINAMSDPYPDISIDANQENNPAFRDIRIVSKRRMTCP